MVKKSLSLIDELVPNIQDRHLISGGAAWADHCAISLFLMNKANKLELFFPCCWDKSRKQFYYSPEDWNKMPSGKVANYYHSCFSRKLDKSNNSSLIGIQKAINKGAQYHEIQEGFKARNLLVGDCCDILIAFTWGEEEIPKSLGTLHTWTHSRATRKIHVPLITL